jgi:hypothetical protein
MKATRRLLVASMIIVALDFILVRIMAHGHVAHALLAGGPSVSAGLLAAALVLVRFVAVVIVPGLLATAATLATAHYFVGSRSTGTSSGANGADALAEAEGIGTSIGARGSE